MKKDLRAVMAMTLLLTGLAGLATAHEPAPACDPCCPPPRKVCCPAPAKKTTTHTDYSVKCEDYCLPRSCCLSKLFGKKNDCGCCDAGCAGTVCGKVRERRRLVKKFRKEECDTTKCEVIYVADPVCCEAAPACEAAVPVTPSPMPPVK